MIFDGRKIPDGETIHADLCVIGAGVAGICLARQFSKSSLKIAVIESGGLKPDKKTQSLYYGENIGIPYYPLDTARARFFGGSSHYWRVRLPDQGMGVRLRPMDPIDFTAREWIPYSGWPYDKRTLDPYYEEAQHFCRIGPFRYDPEYWNSDGRRALTFKDDRVKTTLFQFAERGVIFREHGNALERDENTTVYLHSNAAEIESTPNAGEVTRVRVKCLEGPEFFVRAKHYVIATGAIETARLLLLSSGTCKTGLGNQNDLVGRFFMEHPHLWSGRFVPANLAVSNATEMYRIFKKNGTYLWAKLTLAEETLRTEKLANWVASIHVDWHKSYDHYMLRHTRGVASYRALRGVLGGNQPVSSILKNAIGMIGDPGNVAMAMFRKIKGGFAQDFDRSKYIAVFKLNHMSEQTPNPDSRVTLADSRDALGQRRAQLDWRLNDIDIRTITRAQQIVDAALRRSGLGRIDIETREDRIPPKIHGGWHHMGTTRMHDDPRQGVVNSDCRVHGVSNLFIAGASIFPTVGYANPVLTTLAVVLRLSRHIKKLYDVAGAA